MEQGNTILEFANSKNEVRWFCRKRLRYQGVVLVIRIDSSTLIYEQSYIRPRLVSTSVVIYRYKKKNLSRLMLQRKNLSTAQNLYFIENSREKRHLALQKYEKFARRFQTKTYVVKQHESHKKEKTRSGILH